MSSIDPLGKYRRVLFPVCKTEYLKFFSLLGIFVFISFNYNLLHNLKDILLLQHTGKAEILPFLKIYLVAPSMLLMIYIYVKISKSVDLYARFTIVIVYFFIVIALLYSFFIPNLEVLKLDRAADFLSFHFSSMKYLWETLRYWPISLLYIHGEAWSSIVLSVSFWGLANEIVSFEEAGRMYSFLTAIGSAIGSISAGLILKSSLIQRNCNNGIGIVCIAMVFMAILFNIFKKNFQAYRTHSAPIDIPKAKKLSVWQSLKTLFRSKHLILIVTIVLSYNVFIHLFEAIWKNQVSIFSHKAGHHFLAIIFGNQAILIGCFVLVFGLLAPLIKQRGWKKTAMVTPVIGLVATSIFSLFLFRGEFLCFLKKNLDLTYLSVLVGLLNIVIIKSSKYVLFDSTKEQAYIPLTLREKLEGKSAIDGVCSRFGKSIGGVILSAPYIGIIHLFGSISASTGVISVVLIVILLIWLKAVSILDRSIKKKLKESEYDS